MFEVESLQELVATLVLAGQLIARLFSRRSGNLGIRPEDVTAMKKQQEELQRQIERMHEQQRATNSCVRVIVIVLTVLTMLFGLLLMQ